MAPQPVLNGHRILVLEDDDMIAEILVEFLQDAGAQVIGPFSWVDEAVDFVESCADRLDGAVLDLNLHGRKSYPVADALISRSVPFVFATGYGAGTIEPRYLQYPRCEKPFSQTAVIAALAGS